MFRWAEDETKDPVRDGEAELKEIYVDPDRWGEGYGTALLQAGNESLPTEVSSLALESLERNEVAVGFYIGREFRRDGTATGRTGGGTYRTLVLRKPV